MSPITINLGSNFLERLGDQASGGFGRASRSNPGGGGASEALDGQVFRSWGEALRHFQHDRPARPFLRRERSDPAVSPGSAPGSRRA